jgi:nucleoside-diphosphate-sugar epimerase
MKAIVTGAAGFIGSHLSEHLVHAGHTVVGIDVFTDYYPRDRKEQNLTRLRSTDRFTLVETALADTDWDRLLEGVTWIFHLAAQAGVRKSWGRDFHVYTINNVEGTQILLEACKRRPIERLVYASSSSVYGDDVPLPMNEDARPQPVSPYGVTKLSAEQLCHLYFANYGVPAVSVRYFTVYGPRQRPDMGFHKFFQAAMRNEPVPVFGDGRQTRDFTFVSDAVAATVSASTRGVPGGVYNIGGGSRVELLDVFELIGRVTGRPLRLNMIEPQAGDMRDTYADTARARTDLAFAPAVTLEQGLRAQFQWMTEAGLFNT